MSDMKNKTEIIEDEIISEIHRVRADLLSENDGSISSLVKKIQSKQETSGKKLIERLNPRPSKLRIG